MPGLNNASREKNQKNYSRRSSFRVSYGKIPEYRGMMGDEINMQSRPLMNLKQLSMIFSGST
jgi:hypothetical protein